jgi:hypothetical protein
LKSALKSDSFDVSIGIKIPFSRVLVTIEPGRSFLLVRYHDLFDIYLKTWVTKSFFSFILLSFLSKILFCSNS